MQVPQVHGVAERFVSRVLPQIGRTVLGTRPLDTPILGGWVRDLSDRDVARVLAEAGLGLVSKSTVHEITQALPAGYRASPGAEPDSGGPARGGSAYLYTSRSICRIRLGGLGAGIRAVARGSPRFRRKAPRWCLGCGAMATWRPRQQRQTRNET